MNAASACFRSRGRSPQRRLQQDLVAQRDYAQAVDQNLSRHHPRIYYYTRVHRRLRLNHLLQTRDLRPRSLLRSILRPHREIRQVSVERSASNFCS